VKLAAVLLLSSGLGAHAWAQPLPAPARSVWMEDHSPETVKAAVASGKTTQIYSGGSSTAVANHVQVARYVAQRVAEELANALVLPVTPDAPGAAYDSVNRAIRMGGFKDVMVVADEGTGPDDRRLESIAKKLDAEWKPSGVNVYYITAHEMRPGQGMTFNGDYLRRWAGRTVPAARRKMVEDEAELLYVDPGRRWLGPNMIPIEDRQAVTPALGKILLEERVSSILNQIRTLSPAHLR
jgi:hypothetical protein